MNTYTPYIHRIYRSTYTNPLLPSGFYPENMTEKVTEQLKLKFPILPIEIHDRPTLKTIVPLEHLDLCLSLRQQEYPIELSILNTLND